jgi:hypothetical protein
VLYDVSSPAARDIAEYLRARVQNLAIDTTELNILESLSVTVSVGGAAWWCRGWGAPCMKRFNGPSA